VTATTSAERAREAAERLEAAQAVGRQLSLLAAEASPADPADLPAGPGRPKGSRNRRTSKLRQMLAARGLRMPEDVVAETAGLNARVSGVELAMQRAEQVAAWLTRFPVGTDKNGDTYGAGKTLSRSQMEGLFLAIYREQGDAAAALLPYGLERLTPESGPVIAPTVIMLPQGGQPGDQARVIEGQSSDMAPPPLPSEVEGNQWLTNALAAQSDGSGRTV
jgi:hypothetical protein